LFSLATVAAAPAKKAIDPNRQMIVAIAGLPNTGDCQNTSSIYVRLGLTQQVYDYLMKKDSAGNIVPNLVKSYKMAEDAKSCKFVLNKGIKFHDGTELTAKDIQFTIARAKTCTGSIKGYCADIERVDVVDNYNFTIVMANANVALLEYLTCIPIMCAEFTKACGDKYGTDVDKIMGSGPYKIKEWKFGDHIVFEAFKDYFAGAPAVKSVMLKVISDTNAAVIALQTHEIDLYMNDVPYISISDVKANNSLNVEFFSSTRYNYVLFNAEQGKFADERMRQAVAYAINRNDMLILACEDLANGYIVNSPAGPDFVANPGYQKWPYAQDVKKATALVKEAGHYGESVTVYTLAVDPYPKLASKLQDSLSQIGLKCNIVQMENSAYISDVCDKGKFEIAICFNTFPAKDMDIAIGAQLLSAKSGLSGNYGRYKDPEMDKLILKAKVVSDPKKRIAAYQDILDLFAKKLPSVPLYFAKSSRAYNADLAVVSNSAQYDRLYYYSWK
jgi:peptide/nickel transport system substrate-binding protein